MRIACERGTNNSICWTRGFGLRDHFATSDAMYVALAELSDGVLLTADRAPARAVATHTRVVEEV